jgi:hypothetical protein
MIWTQEQRDELVALWDNGKRSYSEIARILGIRKNMVVGRMRREKKIRGLPVMDQFSHKTKAGKKKTFNVYRPKPRRKAVIDLPSVPAPDLSRATSIVDVTGCRWAVSFSDDVPGGHLFCNHDTDGKTAYCAHHARENVAPYSRSLINKTTRAVIARLKRVV